MVVVVADHQMMSFYALSLSASRPLSRLFLRATRGMTSSSSVWYVNSFTCHSITNCPSFSDRLFLHHYLFLNKWLLGHFNLFSHERHFNFCLRVHRTLCR